MREEEFPVTGPGCPACKEQRTHTDEEWKNHPFHKHGMTREQGYTLPELDPTHPNYVPPATRKEEPQK